MKRRDGLRALVPHVAGRRRPFPAGSGRERVSNDARWRRNLAVALGNAWRESGDPGLALALLDARDGADDLLREHIDWALAQRPIPAAG